MGCPFTLFLLNRMPQEWKDKHIKALVSCNGAWGGAVEAVQAVLEGK